MLSPSVIHRWGKNMERIQQVSHYFVIVLKFLLVLLPMQLILKWVYVSSASMQASIIATQFLSDVYVGIVLTTVIWSPLAKTIGIAAYLLELFPIMISLVALVKLFQNYEKGEIFSPINAKYFRYIGIMFVFYGLVSKILHDSLMTVAITINNPPGERMISFGFGSANLEAIFTGSVIILISWVMLQASVLQEEHRYTV